MDTQEKMEFTSFRWLALNLNLNDPRKLFKIGVSFSTANRWIEDWVVV